MIADVAIYLVGHFSVSGIRKELYEAEKKRDIARAMYQHFGEVVDLDYWESYCTACEVALDLAKWYAKPLTRGARQSAGELKETVNILDVASKYTKLAKRGQEYMGKCPIHPSKVGENFEVNPAKQQFHCFSAQHGGDVIKLLMDVEGLSFQGSLSYLRNNFV